MNGFITEHLRALHKNRLIKTARKRRSIQSQEARKRELEERKRERKRERKIKKQPQTSKEKKKRTKKIKKLKRVFNPLSFARTRSCRLIRKRVRKSRR